MGLCAVFWGHRLFSLVLLVRNAAFIRSTNPCLCQTDPQPESFRVAAENDCGVEVTHKGNGREVSLQTRNDKPITIKMDASSGKWKGQDVTELALHHSALCVA